MSIGLKPLVTPLLAVGVTSITRKQMQTTSACTSAHPCTPKRTRLFTGVEKKQTKKYKSYPLVYIQEELFRYLIDEDTDDMVLLKSAHAYPTLAKLAARILSVLATSALIERVFSQSDFLFRQYRASMSRKSLQLTMLKCNRDLL